MDAPEGSASQQQRTVVVVDDVEQIRLLLARLIATSPGLTLVGQATDFASAFEVIESTRPDIAVIDRSMPGPDPSSAFRLLRARFPDTVLVLLTATPADDLEPSLLSTVDTTIDKCSPLSAVLASLEAVGVAGRRSLSG